MASKLRAAILDDYQNVALRLADWSALSDVDIKVFTEPFASPQATIDALKDFEIVVGMRERTPFPRATIAALPKLKLLITTGAKNNSFDLKAAAEHGVTVCGTGTTGAPTVGVTFGLILELTRRIGFENQRMKAGELWQVSIGRDLEGLTLGIVGFGKLGHRVAAVAQAFGMKVIAWSQNLKAEDAEKAGVGYATKDKLFSEADIVTIHYALSERSRGVVGAADLGRMKRDAYLINTARGPLVDEAALLSVLREKKIAGAGLDVFDVEPLPKDHPFRTLDNVVLTPHLGYVSEQNYRIYFRDIVEGIRAFIDGKPVRVIA